MKEGRKLVRETFYNNTLHSGFEGYRAAATTTKHNLFETPEYILSEAGRMMAFEMTDFITLKGD